MPRDPLVIVLLILVLLWLVGWLAIPATGNLIHLLLVLILIVVLVRLLRGGRVL